MLGAVLLSIILSCLKKKKNEGHLKPGNTLIIEGYNEMRQPFHALQEHLYVIHVER